MSYIPPAGSSPGRSPPMYQPRSSQMQVPRSPRQAPPRPDKLPNQSAGKYSRKGIIFKAIFKTSWSLQILDIQ